MQKAMNKRAFLPFGAGARVCIGNHFALLEGHLSLAALVWQPRFAFIAAPLGIAFHAGILLSGLEIGLFAWLMLAVYLFVIPDRVYIALADRLGGARKAFGVVAAWFDGALGWVMWLVGIALGLVFAMLARSEYAGRVGVVLLVATIAGTAYSIVRAPGARRMTAIGLAHLAAFTLWLDAEAVWLQVDRGTWRAPRPAGA